MHEFEIALHHNIVVKRKKRVIVLMALNNADEFCSIEDSDTAVLRQYLRQYTYIDYTTTDNDWLDKLLYTLPLNGMDHIQLNDDHEGFDPVDDDTIPLQ